ncbi:MAG: Fic/DOC family N-terminal domain-containing protein [Acidimicrobiia bacterium]
MGALIQETPFAGLAAPLKWSPDLLRLLSDADRSLGRLDGMARSLPDSDLFVAMYVRRRARHRG